MPKSSAIVVAGLPRSGTTWIARLLSYASGTSLLGREPMNPMPHQFNLAGLATNWTSLDAAASANAATAWRRVLTGRERHVRGKLGRRQWLAPLPRTQVIVKDPFASLSLRFLKEEFSAQTLAVFRAPEAILASQRRMGWSANWRGVTSALDVEVQDSPGSDVEAAALLWSTLYRHILEIPDHAAPLIVSHADVAHGGAPATKSLLSELGLTLGERGRNHIDREFQEGDQASPPPGQLHAEGRDPRSTTAQWRDRVSDSELEHLHRLTRTVNDELMSRRITLRTAGAPATSRHQQ